MTLKKRCGQFMAKLEEKDINKHKHKIEGTLKAIKKTILENQ
jgi:hypothetical protein